MPHFPKPFLKKSRGLWYVEINRKQINLGPDKDDAFRQYHQLMGQPREQAVVSPESLTVIIDAFLEWTYRNRAPDTYEWYRQRLQRFVSKYPQMTVQSFLLCGAPHKRKAWLFVSSVAGGERSAKMMSLVSSARRYDLDSRLYIEDILAQLLAGSTDYESLLPDVWKEARPEAIRTYRQEERRDKADRKQLHAARRRLLRAQLAK